MKVGDVIDVSGKADAVNKMIKLAQEGVDTDFLYLYKRRKGLWLEVKEIKDDKSRDGIEAE